MELVADLIYDVGVNNGDDTAYYLRKGYRVLGIEADPTLMAPLRDRFTAEIAKGQLMLLNVALAPDRKVAPFWICEGYSLWNSFDREVASRMGGKCHAVELECWPLRDIFGRYGVPHYLKLSLHGQEHFCLVDIKAEVAPPYLSLELPRDLAISEQIMDRLSALRYDSFKVIDQALQRQLAISPPTLKSRLKNGLRRNPPLYRACESVSLWIRRLVGSEKQGPAQNSSSRTDAVAGWVFPAGSSGPFGEETQGSWKTCGEIRVDWRAFLTGETDQGPPSLSIWHDLHARRRISQEQSAS